MPNRRIRAYKENILHWAESSSTHGVPNIVKSGSILRKLIWALVVLVALCFTAYQTRDKVMYYRAYPILPVSREIYEGVFDFPAVTVCTGFPLKFSGVMDVLINRSQLTSRRLKDYWTFGDQAVSQLKTLFPLQDEVIRHCGIQSRSNNSKFVDCAYLRTSLNTAHVQNIKGSCVTVHSDISKMKNKIIRDEFLEKISEEDTKVLKLILNPKVTDALDMGWNGNLLVSVHPHVHNPNNFWQVAPGAHVRIEVKNSSLSRIPTDNNCIFGRSRGRRRSEIAQNVMYVGEEQPYDRADCVLKCKCKRILKNCGCIGVFCPRTKTIDGYPICKDHYQNVIEKEQIACAYKQEKRGSRSCYKSCPARCDNLFYSLSWRFIEGGQEKLDPKERLQATLAGYIGKQMRNNVTDDAILQDLDLLRNCRWCADQYRTWTYWESNNTVVNTTMDDILFDLPINESLFNHTAFIRHQEWEGKSYDEHLIAVTVQIGDASYTEVSEQYAYSFIDLAADLGGLFGLYLGLSVIAIVEVIELVLDMAFFGWCGGRKKHNRREVEDSKPTSNAELSSDLEAL